MNRIAFCGNLIVDEVKMITSWPEKGMLVPITSVSRAVGGSVCNSGIDLKTLDPSVEVKALGKVGEHFTLQAGMAIFAVTYALGAVAIFLARAVFYKNDRVE